MTKRALPGLLMLLFSSASLAAPPVVPLFNSVSGEYREVLVEQGDTLDYISARHGVPVSSIMRDNSIADEKKLPAGKILTVNTRRVAPAVTGNGFVADIAGGMLYRFEEDLLIGRYPAGFGDAKRQTPQGEYTITGAVNYPDRPYPSSRGAERDRELLASRSGSPPGEDSSLGPFWISLSPSSFGIHATPFTSTIGSHEAAKHVRLGAENMGKLVDAVKPGMKLVSVYYPSRLAITPDGAIWLEAHPDVYGLGVATAEAVLSSLGGEAAYVDKDAISKVLREKRGSAEIIGNIPGGNGQASPHEYGESESASFRCLDCPPGEDRRVTLQLAAKAEITLEGEYPIEVLDAAGNVVFASGTTGNHVKMSRGEERNFIWELTDSHGRPLPMGQYTVKALFYDEKGEPDALSLPLWADR